MAPASKPPAVPPDAGRLQAQAQDISCLLAEAGCPAMPLPEAVRWLIARQPPRPTRASLTRWAEDHDVDLVFFDPPEHFDHAILGVIEGHGQEPAVLYDQALVLEALSRDLGPDDALEWFDANTLGAYVGEATPRFLIRPED